jgi:DNA-binding transcriptional MerR regulator
MRISDLARASGLPVATIKYYLREGLLPPGRRRAATQADYDEAHLARLRLLRILREFGRVPVGRLRELVAATEDPGRSTHEVLLAAARALAPLPPSAGPLRAQARAAADARIAGAGWSGVAADAPDRENLAAAIEAVTVAGTHAGGLDALRPYVEAADAIGRFDVGDLRPDQTPAAIMEQMVVGQVVFGEILLTLRRLAEEHYSARQFGAESARG